MLDTRRRRLLMTLMGGGKPTYAQVVASIAPDFQWAMRATSGATETNLGSAGASYNAAINGGITLGQVGQLGANEAHTIDGTTGYYQVTTGAALQGSSFWWGCLVNPNTSGELTSARFVTNGASQTLRFNTALTSLVAIVPATGNASSTTNSGIAASTWAWVFMAYDDSGLILGDRGAHIYKGDLSTGTVTEFGYSAFTPATGTFTSPAADCFLANNNSGAAVTFDGKIDEIIRKNSLPATSAALLAQWTQLVRASAGL